MSTSTTSNSASTVVGRLLDLLRRWRSPRRTFVLQRLRLRSRLMLAFVSVIGLNLLLTGGAIAFLIRDYRMRIAIDHMSELSMISTFIVRQLEAQSVSPDDIASVVVDQVRGEADTVLIVEADGKVVAQRSRAESDDTEEYRSDPTRLAGSLLGKLIAIPASAAVAPTPSGLGFEVFGRHIDPPNFARPPGRQSSGLARTRFGRVVAPVIVWEDTTNLETPYLLLTADLGQMPPPGDLGPMRMGDRVGRAGVEEDTNRTDRPRDLASRQPPGMRGPNRTAGGGADTVRPVQPMSRYRIILAMPSQKMLSTWSDLGPRFAVSTAIGLTVALLVATTIAASISRGIGRITVAAQQIAGGDVHVRVPMTGSDEIGLLGQSFNEMADEVSRSQEALRNFVADASHELRTPLTAVQGFATALTDGTILGDEESVRAGSIISEEATRMRVLVEDLLYLSKVEALRSVRRIATINLEEIAREAVRRVQPRVVAGHRTVVIASRPIPNVAGDPGEIDVLVGNLIENAVKYSPPGATITIDFEHERQVNQSIVRVHNTGSVIAADDLPHIFERFYRADKSRAQTTEGSGLGLAIAREIARRHGGEIDAKSGLSEGTLFTLRIPSQA